MLIFLAALPLIIWVVLLLGRDSFWRVSEQFPPKTTGEPPQRSVIAVIPARNEADAIGQAVRSLFEQDPPGVLGIVVVDDNSADGTGALAHQAAVALGKEEELLVLSGQPLPAGWTGKMWAVSQGVAEAEALNPDYLLLTDADIRHSPDNLRTLVGMAESGGYDLVSFMVKLQCSTLAEKMLIPAFVFFFFLLYPPAAIRKRYRKTAGAAGGCMLIRTRALQLAGGIGRIRSEVIDDCALARAVKSIGGRIWLGLTPDTFSLRTYTTFGEMRSMISRTAFNQLQHSWGLLAGTCGGLALVYLLPIALLFSGHWIPALLGLSAWALMSVGYAPMVQFYGQPRWWSATLPLAALFYMAATIDSAIQYARGRGGQWKGRSQDVRAD